MRYLTVLRNDEGVTLQQNHNIETMDDFIIKRDAWHDLVAQLGTPMPQELPSNFYGQGSKEGYRYYKHLSVGKYYFYQVTNTSTGEIHYEVFKTDITGERRNRRELFPYESPLSDSVEEFTNSQAANFRFGELLREHS